MRSVSKALAGVLLLAACGNLSNEDIAFVEALPRTGDLHVQIQVDLAAQQRLDVLARIGTDLP